MIIFHNPGLLDLEAVRLMGASVKVPGSFGRFGTGLKYALASILRAGASLRLIIGEQEYSFGTLARQVKGEAFAEVVMFESGASGYVGKEVPLGFTTALGRDWEPWMVVRELACNARDEEGDFARVHAADLEGITFGAPDGPAETVFILDWPELEESWDEVLKDLFVPAELEPLETVEGVRIFPGRAEYIYHRGVRVMKLPKEAAFTYDIVASVDLTEDRTAKYDFIIRENIRRALFASKDPGIIAGAVTNTKGWESALGWTDTTWRKPEPGVVWLEEIARLRARGASVADDAKKLFLAHRAVKEAKSFGGYYRSETPAALDIAMGALKELRIDFKDEDIYVTRELPGEVLSMASGGRIYISELLLSLRPYLVAQELLTRHLELRSAGDHDKLLSEVIEVILRAHPELERDRGLYQEEIAGKEKAA